MNKQRQLDIERIADDVRKDCMVTNYGIPNIFDSTEKMNYRVVRYPIGSESLLGFALIKDNERVIFSNSSSILSREIFTVAHEIGHHKLHLSEIGLKIIKDDDFKERDENEIEANFFAACLLIPKEEIQKFIRLELNDREINRLNGLDIARIQTEFNVSYDMALVRLRTLNILDDIQIDRLKMDKMENSATKLLNAINGNVDLCKSKEVKRVPAEYLEWAISNYNYKLIPKKSLERVLNYVDIKAEDIESSVDDPVEEESFDDLLKGMD